MNRIALLAAHNSAVPKTPFRTDSVPAIAERLRTLRKAYGPTQVGFTARVGINQPTWNNWEREIGRISLDEAMKLVRAIGVTLDWIYRGETSTLRLDIQDRLREAESDPLAAKAKGA